jgi:hypothetical protein
MIGDLFPTQPEKKLSNRQKKQITVFASFKQTID